MAQLFPKWAENVRMNEKTYRLLKKAKNSFLKSLKSRKSADRGESKILDEKEGENAVIYTSNL
jgi:hypothetical protein